jgi:hypothetical protein
VRRSPLARPLTALVAATLVTGALAGCSGFPFGGGCTPPVPSGDASSTIVATGDVGEQPSIEFPTPLVVDSAQRSVITAGEGDPIGEYSTVGVEITVLNAATGDVLETSAYGGSASTSLFTSGESLGVLGDAFLCATVGSRLALVAPTEMFSNDFDATVDLSGQSYVVVIDIVQAWLGKANGMNQLPLDGMPTVVTAVDGTPGVSVSTQAVPTTTRTSTIKAGAGATLADGDTAIVHIRNWSWSSEGDVTLSSIDTWATHAPVRAVIDPDTTDDTLPVELYEQLVGAKVGSQLLVVVPDDDGANGAKIFVVDVLGIDHDDQ